MGLSAPRKRGKLAEDPNNTAWTRSASRFGHKLLRSQGWTPGSSLGANNASYVNSHTKISPIKVTVRDDGSGLGASIGRDGGESHTTGLDGLQNLLGRLNGKDTQLLQSEQRNREEIRKNIYAGRRWGFDNFVSGGFLVGDRIQQQKESAPTDSIATSFPDAPSPKTIHKNKSTKGATKHKAAPEKEILDAIQGPITHPKGYERHLPSLDQNDAGERPLSLPRTADNEVLEPRHREKLEYKARRRARKAERLSARDSKARKPHSPDSRSTLEPSPIASLGAANEGDTGERYAVRRRMIQQKKMSLANPKALNEQGKVASHVVNLRAFWSHISPLKLSITMSNENSPPPTPPSPQSARRSSFSPGQLFGRGPATSSSATTPYPTPIATAAASAQVQQRRRLSITSLGLSGSPTQTSAFARARQGSLSSGASNTTSIDENAIEEGDAPPLSASPTSPFARRMSSGARALRDVRTGSGNANGRSSTAANSAPSVKGRVGEGWNWSDQLRSRAERSSSTTNPPTSTPAVSTRERQAATDTAPPVEVPAKRPAQPVRVPDQFQERILKGDFYMD
ncbi:MAG: hypothetical protein Q9220_007121 [cf. Caloplaca sp. 1 TL-2023]